MQQIEMSDRNTENFLYGEIQKIRKSVDKQLRAMGAIISELQDQVLISREEKE